MENLKRQGAELIEQLKAHIRRVMESQEHKARWSLGQIEESSGLMILGRTGQNVWDMAVATLVIELVKDGVLESTIPVKRLNTKSATGATFWLKR